MKPFVDPGMGGAVTILLLGSLALTAAVALVTAPLTPGADAVQDDASTSAIVAYPAPLVSSAVAAEASPPVDGED